MVFHRAADSPRPPRLQSKSHLFPAVPTAEEVSRACAATNASIAASQTHLASLMSARERVGDIRLTHPFDLSAFGVLGFRGLLMNHPLFDEFRRVNQARIQQANSMATVYSSVCSSDYQFLVNLRRADCDPVPTFSVVFGRRLLQHERDMKLVGQYMSVYDLWRRFCGAVDQYNVMTHVREEWGTPQATGPTRWRKELGLAPDVPMHRDGATKEGVCFDNRNLFVKDPIKSHQQFVRRLRWTDPEKIVFYRKLRAFGKNFHRIAECLPMRSTKEVVDFYYMNRFAPYMLQVMSSPRFAQKARRNYATPHSNDE
jgi:hypothetical protein